MTKNEFREELLNCGFSYLYVVSFPDFKGGRDIGICVDEPQLGDFEYIEWEGDLTEALRDRHLVFTTWDEPFHEERKEYEITLEDLIVASLSM